MNNVEKLAEELVFNVSSDGSGQATAEGTAVILRRLGQAANYLALWSTFEGEAEEFFARLGDALLRAALEEDSK